MIKTFNQSIGRRQRKSIIKIIPIQKYNPNVIKSQIKKRKNQEIVLLLIFQNFDLKIKFGLSRMKHSVNNIHQKSHPECHKITNQIEIIVKMVESQEKYCFILFFIK